MERQEVCYCIIYIGLCLNSYFISLLSYCYSVSCTTCNFGDSCYLTALVMYSDTDTSYNLGMLK